MPVIDTSVLLCGLAFSQSDSGRFLEKVALGKAKATVSNAIIEEAINVAGKKAPWLVPRIKEYTEKYSDIVTVTDDDIQKLTVHTKDPNDRHIIATAIISNDRMIYSLDWGFFSNAMNAVSEKYLISAQFPSYDIFQDVENMLKNFYDGSMWSASSRSFSGALTLTLHCEWKSLDRKHLQRRWYILDANNFFGLWYDTSKQTFTFYPYALNSEYKKTVKFNFAEKENIRITVVFDQEIGFDFYINEKEKHCRIPWNFSGSPGDFNIGHNSEKTLHMNASYKGIRLFKGYVDQTTVRKMHRFNLLSVSDKDLEIIKSNRWIVNK